MCNPHKIQSNQTMVECLSLRLYLSTAEPSPQRGTTHNVDWGIWSYHCWLVIIADRRPIYMKQVGLWISSLLSFCIVFRRTLLFHRIDSHTTGKWCLCRYLQIVEPNLIAGVLLLALSLVGLGKKHVGEASLPYSNNELDRSYSSTLRPTCCVLSAGSCLSHSVYRLPVMQWFDGWHRFESRT